MPADGDDDPKVQWRDPPANASAFTETLAPGEVAFGREGKYLVRIQPDGTVHFSGEYEPDEAARDFWAALARKHPGLGQRQLTDEERTIEMNRQVMETLIVRLGNADLSCEQMSRRAAAEGATEGDRFRAEIARRNLEAIAHTVIEFSRGVALAARQPPENPSN